MVTASPDPGRANEPTARSTTSRPSRTRDAGDDELFQLLERLGHRIRAPGASVERFLRGVEVTQDQQRLAAFFLEGHRSHGPAVITFFVRPDETRVRCHFEVLAVERH